MTVNTLAILAFTSLMVLACSLEQGRGKKPCVYYVADSTDNVLTSPVQFKHGERYRHYVCNNGKLVDTTLGSDDTYDYQDSVEFHLQEDLDNGILTTDSSVALPKANRVMGSRSHLHKDSHSSVTHCFATEGGPPLGPFTILKGKICKNGRWEDFRASCRKTDGNGNDITVEHGERYGNAICLDGLLSNVGRNPTDCFIGMLERYVEGTIRNNKKCVKGLWVALRADCELNQRLYGVERIQHGEMIHNHTCLDGKLVGVGKEPKECQKNGNTFQNGSIYEKEQCVDGKWQAHEPKKIDLDTCHVPLGVQHMASELKHGEKSGGLICNHGILYFDPKSDNCIDPERGPVANGAQWKSKRCLNGHFYENLLGIFNLYRDSHDHSIDHRRNLRDTILSSS